MLSLLDFRHYTSPEVAADEGARIFRRFWIFAGFRTLVAVPDSFLTRSIDGVPIVVQNCGGELRAFVNQCAHRQAPLQQGDYGQRRLACPYHGWVYDSDGRVRSIPGCEANYGFTEGTTQELGLRRIAIRSIGNLVFVNLDPNPMPLEAQFHTSFISRLEEVSGYLDTEAILAKFSGLYNWKLTFENVLDYNHVPFVHAASFAMMIPGIRSMGATNGGACAPPPQDRELSTDVRDLSFSTEAPFDFPYWPWHDRVDRFSDTPTYYNFFIFPNVNFISLAATTFLVQQFNPKGPAETEVSLTLSLARKRKKLPASSALLWSHLKSEKRVIDEDIVVLEGVQRGLFEGGSGAFHGTCETRLRTMANVYKRILGSAEA